MHETDLWLTAYARSRLQDTHPADDPDRFDTMLDSAHFKQLKDRFDVELERLRRRYFGIAAPAGAASSASSAGSATTAAEPIPYVMKDLKQMATRQSAPAVPSAPPGAAPAAAPSTPAILSDLPDLHDGAFRLPHARAGDLYRQPIEADGAPDAIIYCEVTAPAGLALTLDQAAGTLAGMPEQAGQYSVSLAYRYAGEAAGRLRTATVKLVVTANPKTLWRELATDRNAVYWRPDQRCERVDGPQFRMLAASKRGRSHAHAGSFRDDDYAIACMPESGWYLAIVADGAGSARYARKGAAIICQEAQATLQALLAGERGSAIDQAARAYQLARTVVRTDPVALDTLWQTLRNALYGAVGHAAYHAAKGIADESARRREQEPDAAFKDYASTALIAICKRYDFGTLCAAYWVGDGAVGVYSEKDGITLLGEVDSGEYSGQTRFLESAHVTEEALLRRTRFAIVDDMTALVLMSDGVSDPKFETEARLGRPDDWHLLWGELEQAVGLNDGAGGKEQKLLDWLDFWSQGNHDDRTIAIVY